ncbi:MAG: glycosyltransferase family 2 protein [Cyanobacteria bacterium SZAS LIN-3]|nr:glycosyltransferase family 2 protein [Cyanobacteria bacterium SZAS LIN-3]MBS2007859.1 glycosyltransferase family 2 protein [Cyanobacteria bacterium SZAS TMP-1]
MSGASLDLSVIVAVYNEDPRNLTALINKLAEVLVPTGLKYEVVFVNDGSRAPTSDALRVLACENDGIKLIELSRNFGQQAAITCGLDHSEGLAVVNIDSDLQDPPDLIPEMVALWKQGYDVVYATRSTRRDRFAKRFSAHVFYRILAAVSTVEIPRDTGDFRLMDRKVLEALASLPEKTRFLRGMIPWLGFKQCGIAIDRGAREMGESTYTLKKLITLSLDGLLAFSVAPLYFVASLGLGLIAIGALALIASLLFLAGAAAQPQAVLVSCLALFAGIQIACTGVVAIYLSKVLDEARARPTYIVGNRIGRGFAGLIQAGRGQTQSRDAEKIRQDLEVSASRSL